MRVRTIGLLVVLLAAIWFGFINTRSAIEIIQSGLDRFDSRPERSILILGNGRAYFHGMPRMVRLIADSANAPQKYQIRTRAFAGASLEDHWKDSVTQKLLSGTWDDIILQAESRSEWDENCRNSFTTYGQKLMWLARTRGKAALIVNWTYGNEVVKDLAAFNGVSPARMREIYYQDLQRSHASLAHAADAQLINVGYVWESVLLNLPSMPLYEDGNLPTIAGSYLTALMIYAYLSHHDLSLVTYVPSGISADQAKALRQTVDRHISFRRAALACRSSHAAVQ